MSLVPGCPGVSSAPRGEAEVPGVLRFSTTSVKHHVGLGSSALVLLKPLPKAGSANAWLALPDQPKRGSEREGGMGGLRWGSWWGLSRPTRAAGGRGSPSARSESVVPACCSRSSSDRRTSSYRRASWRRRCCNGSPRAAPGTGTPRPVAAGREPCVAAVSPCPVSVPCQGDGKRAGLWP